MAKSATGAIELTVKHVQCDEFVNVELHLSSNSTKIYKLGVIAIKYSFKNRYGISLL